jgi:hypothetical protein
VTEILHDIEKSDLLGTSMTYDSVGKTVWSDVTQQMDTVG